MDKPGFLEELKKQSPLPNMDPEVFDALRQLVPMVAVELLVTRTEGGFGLKKKKIGETEGWSLPGGFVGLNETFEGACERIADKELGIKVIIVNEAYTSKTCSACGLIHKIGSKSVLKCECGLTIDRDLNGARGIFLKNLSLALDDTPFSLFSSS